MRPPTIACSLGATDLAARHAEMTALGDALLDARVNAGRAELRFRPQARERVTELAAAEHECCPFLAMRIGAEPGAVVLSIDAPPGAEVVLRGIVDAFCGPR